MSAEQIISELRASITAKYPHLSGAEVEQYIAHAVRKLKL